MEDYLKRRIEFMETRLKFCKDDSNISLDDKYAYHRGYNRGVINGMLMAYENVLDKLSDRVEYKFDFKQLLGDNEK